MKIKELLFIVKITNKERLQELCDLLGINNQEQLNNVNEFDTLLTNIKIYYKVYSKLRVDVKGLVIGGYGIGELIAFSISIGSNEMECYNLIKSYEAIVEEFISKKTYSQIIIPDTPKNVLVKVINSILKTNKITINISTSFSETFHITVCEEKNLKEITKAFFDIKLRYVKKVNEFPLYTEKTQYLFDNFFKSTDILSSDFLDTTQNKIMMIDDSVASLKNTFLCQNFDFEQCLKVNNFDKIYILDNPVFLKDYFKKRYNFLTYPIALESKIFTSLKNENKNKITLIVKENHWLLKEHTFHTKTLLVATSIFEILNTLLQEWFTKEENVSIHKIDVLGPIIQSNGDLELDAELIQRENRKDIIIKFKNKNVYEVQLSTENANKDVEYLVHNERNFNITFDESNKNKILQIGSRWENLKWKRDSTDGKTLAKLCLNDSILKIDKLINFHPSLLDVGFNIAIKEGEKILPICYDEINIISSISPESYVLAEQINEEGTKFKVSFYNLNKKLSMRLIYIVKQASY